MAGLDFKATLDNADFKNKLVEMQASLAAVSQKVAEQGANMENTFMGVKGSVMDLAAQFGIGFGAVGFAKQVAQVRGQFQALEQSFKVLLRSEEKASDLMSQLTKTAAITPFDLQGVARGAKQLLAYGVAAEDVNKTIVELGDIASGMGLSIDYITQLYGTTISKDTMDTMDLKQFKGQGIAIDQALADLLKVEKTEIPAMITQHKITSDMVKAAISNMAGADGQFGGMMEQQSKTILGQISNLEDAIDAMFNNIGKQTEGVISDVLSSSIYIIENYEEIGKQIAELVAAYGVYKAALISISAYQSSGAKAELEMLRELTEGVQAQGDAELEALVKKGALTEAEAAEIITLRAEIEAREQEAQATFDMARESKAAANAAVMEAQAQLSAAKAAKQTAAMKVSALEASLATATAEERVTLQKELDVAVSQQEAAAQAVVNAEKELGAARSVQVAAGEQVETAQRNLNTASIQRATIAQKAHASMTNMLANAQKMLKKALDATGLSMLANPYVAAAAAIAAVGYAIYKCATYTSDYEKSLDQLNATRAVEIDKVNDEKKKLGDLINNLKELDRSSDEYKVAKQKLVDQYGKYRDNLDDELDKTTDLVNVHRALALAIQDEADMKAYNAEKDRIESEYAEQRSETLKDVSSDIKAFFGDDSVKANDFYQKLQKTMRDGTLKVKNETLFGQVQSSKITADRNNDDAAYVANMLNEIDKSFRERNALTNNRRLLARVGMLFGQTEDRDQLINDAKVLYDITAEKEARVSKIHKRESDKKAAEEAESANKGVVSGLAEIIKQIQIKEAELVKAQNGFRNKLKKEGALGEEVFYKKEDVEDAKKALNELKSAYELATNIKYDDRKKLRDNLTAAEESGVLLDRAAEKEIKQQQQKQADEDTQYQIDLMNDSFEKRSLQRKLNNEKAIRDIEAQGDEEKKARMEAAKSAFEQAESLAEAAAQSKGSKYERKQFSQLDWEASTEGQAAYAEVDKRTEERIAKTTEIQNKAEQRALIEDMVAREKYYNDLINIQKAYLEEKMRLDLMYADGQLSDETYNTMLGMAEDKKKNSLEQGGYTQADLDNNISTITDTINSVLYGSVENLITNLKAAVERLRVAQAEGNQESVAEANAEIQSLYAELQQNEKEGKLKKDPARFIKAWEKYGSAVKNVTGRVKNLTAALGDDADKTLAAITDISDGLFEVMDNITALTDRTTDAIVDMVDLSDTSVEGLQKTSEAGAKTMESVEKASVILAIIAAAYQIIQKLGEFMKTADDQYKEAAEKQAEINALTLSVQEYEQAVAKAQRTENRWFSSTGLNDFGEYWHDAQDAMDNYYTKAYEQQAEYQNEASGGWLKKAGSVVTAPLKGLTSLAEKIPVIGDSIEAVTEKVAKIEPTQAWQASLDEYEKGFKKAMDNLRIETKAASKGFLGTGIGGKSQKTQDLREWVKERYKDDLFDESDNLNIELAKKVIDQHGSKLQGETEETLKQLIEYQESLNEAMDNMKEYVSNMYSPLVDNMTDALFNWLTTGEDVMDSFEDYSADTFKNIAQEMVKMLVQDQIFGDYKENMMQVYQDYAAGKYGEVGSENALKKLSKESAALSADVKNNFEQNAEGLKAFTQSMADTYKAIGVDIVNTEEQDEATYGGYETMSEETGTELSGRFSAMYIVQSEHLELARNMALAVDGAINILTQSNGLLEDMLSLQVQSNDHLNTIANMAKGMYQNWSERIENIERYTKNLS